MEKIEATLQAGWLTWAIMIKLIFSSHLHCATQRCVLHDVGTGLGLAEGPLLDVPKRRPIFLSHNNFRRYLLIFSFLNNKGLEPQIRPFYFEKMAKSSCYGTSLQCRSTLVITRYSVFFLNDWGVLLYRLGVLYHFTVHFNVLKMVISHLFDLAMIQVFVGH